jgi:DNA-binding NtrC family response regulator
MNLIKPKTASVLVVDDTPENLDVLVDHLKNANFNISVALTGEKAIEITQKMIPNIILLDIKMPGIDGFETCRLLKQNTALQDVPVIFITATAETVDKVKGFAVGGVDYITKPFEHEEALARINAHLTLRHQQQQLAQKNAELTLINEQLKQEISRREQAEEALSTTSDKLSAISQEEAERWGLSAFVGNSKAMKKVITDIRPLQKVEKTSVLILGESGTGKELIARAIHFGGVRAKGSFIPVNCSAVPEQLAESAFLGHVKGAFTGAVNSRKGYFEQAQGGSLFLDEIGDMPLPLQAKLLRTLEDGFITPIGGEQSKPINVRIIAATNADLSAKVTAGLFREDLYFRLASYIITVPPLRERKEDIALLTKHFMAVFAKEMGQKITTLTPQAQVALENYHFFGNIRELKNIVEHALISSGGSPIQPHHLHFVDFTKTVQSAQIAQRDESDEDKILTYIRKHGSINNSQCRQLLDSELRKVSYLLRRMYQEKLLVCEGKRRWAVYRLP